MRTDQRLTTLAAALTEWYKSEQRELPFRKTADPYCIWVSEIMAQQTRITALLPYYSRFIERFPNVYELAKADEDEVLKLWEGLGYYTRARNLHKAARQICRQFNGQLPGKVKELRGLPGIGTYTAGAIMSIAFNQPVPAVDGNVLRVFARLLHITEEITDTYVHARVTDEASKLLAVGEPHLLAQAIMELGALVCIPGTPRCGECQIRKMCMAHAAGEQQNVPVLPVRAEKVVVHRAVLLLHCKEKILVRKRTERLLHNLWEFPGIDVSHEETEEAVVEWLEMNAVKNNTFTEVGRARHVFTHRIWEMAGFRIDVDNEIDIESAVWVDRSRLRELAFPKALHKYYEIIIEDANTAGQV